MTIGIYGRRVIGDEAYERERVIVQKQAMIYGPRVTGLIDEPKPQQPVDPVKAESAETAPTSGKADETANAAGADNYLSVRELDAAVKANPALVDDFLALELKREPFPRATALKSLLAAETSEAGQKRPEVVAKIEAALANIQ